MLQRLFLVVHHVAIDGFGDGLLPTCRSLPDKETADSCPRDLSWVCSNDPKQLPSYKPRAESSPDT